MLFAEDELFTRFCNPAKHKATRLVRQRFKKIDDYVFAEYKKERAVSAGVGWWKLQEWGREAAVRFQRPEFKCSNQWITSFCLRHRLAFRRPTNKKSQSFAERLPKVLDFLQHFRAWLLARPNIPPTIKYNALNSKGTAAPVTGPRHYGRVAPYRRVNVDQVRTTSNAWESSLHCSRQDLLAASHHCVHVCPRSHFRLLCIDPGER